MPPVGFEPTISAGERRRKYALDRAATGTGPLGHLTVFILRLYCTLVRPKLEYVCVTMNPINSSNACKLERIKRKFISLCHYRSSSHLDYGYGNVLITSNYMP